MWYHQLLMNLTGRLSPPKVLCMQYEFLKFKVPYNCQYADPWMCRGRSSCVLTLTVMYSPPSGISSVWEAVAELLCLVHALFYARFAMSSV